MLPSRLGVHHLLPWRGRGTNIARRLQLSHCGTSLSPCNIHRTSELAPKLRVRWVIGRGAFAEFENCSVHPDHPDPVCSRVLVGRKSEQLVRRPRISPELRSYSIRRGKGHSRTATDKARPRDFVFFRTISISYSVFPMVILWSLILIIVPKTHNYINLHMT